MRATLVNRGPGEFVDPAVTPDRVAVLLDDDVVVRSFRMTAYRLAAQLQAARVITLIAAKAGMRR